MTTTLELPGKRAVSPLSSAWEALRGGAAYVLKFIRRKPLGAFGGLLVLTFLLIAIFSPVIAPYDATRSVDKPLLGLSGKHLLGTDVTGKDVLSRVLVGSQISLALAFTVVLINVSMSTLLGLISGYFQGPFDYVIQRSGEVWAAFPGLIALLLIVSLLGPPHTSKHTGPLALFEVAWDMRNLVFAFSLGAVFGGNRVVRGVALSLKNAEYVMAARAIGASDKRIILRHLLPNVMPYVIVFATQGVGGVILGEAALSFLGLGVAPGTPSWGQDLSGRNRTYFIHAPWVALAPGIAISMTVLGFNLFGDALRDILDPRLRGSRGNT
jgi:peptide/nickel transport system permease protein